MGTKLVNVVATLDFVQRSGEILYVNPVNAEAGADAGRLLAEGGMAPPQANSSATMPAQAGKVELRFDDALGRKLVSVHPNVKLSDCEVQRPSDVAVSTPKNEEPTSALVNEFVPYVPGMTTVVLLYDGKEKARFESGLPIASAAGMGLEFPDAALSHRRTLKAATEMPPQAGVSYTVQVKPEGTETWQTIAASIKTPQVQLDRNQFPGAQHARVRVLRSTGFDSEVFTEEDVRLD